MKKSLLFSFALLMAGCAMSNNYYVLSTASQPTTHFSSKNRTIGVEKVLVPKYLFKREIAVAKSASHVTFLDGAVWAEDLDAGLTQRLIGYMQKKFNQPKVYAYPWGTDRQPTVKLKVQVTRFIAQGDSVYLDANWEVENMRSSRRKARLFSVTVPLPGHGSSEIVDAMDRAFGKLEEAIAKGISSF